MKYSQILKAGLWLIVVFFLSHTLFGQIILWNVFLNPISEVAYSIRCKIIDKKTMIDVVSTPRLNEKFVLPCAKTRWWMDDKDFAIELVRHHGYAISSLSPELRKDREIVVTAILSGSGDGFWIYDNDKEIVMTAVRKNGKLLEHASDELKNDAEIYRAAFDNYIWALEFAGQKLKNDAGIVTEAMERDWRNFKYASSELKDNREIALKAVQLKRINFNSVSLRLQSDPEIRLMAKLRDGESAIDVKISPPKTFE